METTGWLHSHWSCHYTDDCKNEAGKERSGFDILATALPLCFISKSETVMGKATLSVFFWVVLSICDSATGPLISFSSFLPNSGQTLWFPSKRRKLDPHINSSADRQTLDMHLPTQTFDASTILNETWVGRPRSVCLWCTALLSIQSLIIWHAAKSYLMQTGI